VGDVWDIFGAGEREYWGEFRREKRDRKYERINSVREFLFGKRTKKAANPRPCLALSKGVERWSGKGNHAAKEKPRKSSSHRTRGRMTPLWTKLAKDKKSVKTNGGKEADHRGGRGRLRVYLERCSFKTQPQEGRNTPAVREVIQMSQKGGS